MGTAQMEVFYDGQCPICVGEMEKLARRDRRDQLRFTDLNADGVDIEALGVSHEALLDRIHARLEDGSIVAGVEVFRHIYRRFGYGPLVALTRIPGISHLLDAAYMRFARSRTRLTGHCADGVCQSDAGAVP